MQDACFVEAGVGSLLFLVLRLSRRGDAMGELMFKGVRCVIEMSR